jgi:uncharacterized membrane protein YqjE
MAEAQTVTDIEEKSLGELVAMASSNVSSLVRSEMELAKLELKSDAKKAALGGTMFAVAGVIACVVVILLSISLAYGFVAMGVWPWLAFLIVSVLYILLAVGLCGLGYLRMRRMSGLKRTLETTKADIAMLRRSDSDSGSEDVDTTEVIAASGRKAITDDR